MPTRCRRSSALALVFCALLITVSGVASAASFRGVLAASNVIGARGEFSALGNRTLPLAVDWFPAPSSHRSPHGVAYAAPHATMTIVEVRWQTLFGEDGPVTPFGSDSSGGGTSTRVTRHELARLEVTPVEHFAESSWSLLPSPVDQLTRVSFGAPVGCEILPGPQMSSPLSALQRRDSLASDSHYEVVADCDSPRLEVHGPHTLAVDGARVAVRAKEGTEGRQLQREYRAGVYAERNQSNPFLYDHIHRRIQFTVVDPDGTIQVGQLQRYRIRAAALAVVGTLRIPTFDGVVEWGAISTEGKHEPILLEGAFAIRPNDSSRLRIAGETTTSASASVSGPGISQAQLTASLGVVAVSLGALGLARLLKPLFGLFTRITQNTALNHERRRLILESVRHNPGLHVEELSRTIGVRRSTVDYHVNVLCEQGLLRCRRFGRSTALFLKGALSPADEAIVYRLRNESYRAIMRQIREDPSASHHALAERAHLSRSRVSKILKDLTGLGLVKVGLEAGRKYLIDEAAVSRTDAETP